ncbi:MAG: alkaline phosphatase family protein [Patescibacteria group bacterium]|nr:alkaline phosphatase family protein [Patescibacteria group bacterium]
MPKRCITLLIDGLSTKKLESFLKRGLLPNIRKLIKRGTYVPTCVSTFPSVTGPSHVPIFTGKNPFHFGISGHNQFNRNYRYFDEYLVNYKALNKKLEKAKTVYEYYKNSVAIGELVYKGATTFIRHYTNALVWLFHNDYDTNRVIRKIIRSYIHGKDLIVGWFPNSDSFQHIEQTDKKLIKMMRKVDVLVGKLLNIKQDNTRIIVCSDHGMEKARKPFRIRKALRQMGLLTHFMRFNFDGGCFGQIYFKHRQKGDFWQRKMSYKKFRNYVQDRADFEVIMKRMAKSKAIEFLMAAKKNTTYIFSQKGVAKILKRGKRYMYQLLEGKDPLRYSEDEKAKKLIDRWITKKECLALSHHTEYPDAIYQIHGLLQLPNAGELIATTEKGITWNKIEPRAAHGGLRRIQMVTPLIVSDKIKSVEKYARTEEIFDYITYKK